MNNKQLQSRLLDFAVAALSGTKYINTSCEGRHLRQQIIRSSTSIPLNYAEARSAESRRDFLHKSKIILKELRETQVCIELIGRVRLSSNKSALSLLSQECNELTAIFVSTIKTTEANLN